MSSSAILTRGDGRRGRSENNIRTLNLAGKADERGRSFYAISIAGVHLELHEGALEGDDAVEARRSEGLGANQGMAKWRLPAEIKAYFVKMGRIGGQIGGKARAAKLDRGRRSHGRRLRQGGRSEKRAVGQVENDAS
jgi:hypothetical protein